MTRSVCRGSKVTLYSEKLEQFMQVELRQTEREGENVLSMCIQPIYEF